VAIFKRRPCFLIAKSNHEKKGNESFLQNHTKAYGANVSEVFLSTAMRKSCPKVELVDDCRRGQTLPNQGVVFCFLYLSSNISPFPFQLH
jgi:hypothetical protein